VPPRGEPSQTAGNCRIIDENNTHTHIHMTKKATQQYLNGWWPCSDSVECGAQLNYIVWFQRLRRPKQQQRNCSLRFPQQYAPLSSLIKLECFEKNGPQRTVVISPFSIRRDRCPPPSTFFWPTCFGSYPIDPPIPRAPWFQTTDAHKI